ncbi:MAG TPA: hypothetical protein VKF16_11650 [Candidatus Dormibacteraeota bacterium]|nr:hypothetical protein [Candidatus Dormibacteraeota bacterium]
MNAFEQELREALRSAYDFGSEYPHPLLITRIYAELERPVPQHHRREWVGGAAAAALAVVVVVTLLWFSFQPRVSTPISSGPPPSGPEAGTAAILANNHLVYLTPGDIQPYWDLALADPPDLKVSHGYAGLGHRIAATPDGALIYALPARDMNGGSELAVVATQSSAERLIQLPDHNATARYGAVSVGPSGDAWIVGSVDKHIEIVRFHRQEGTITSWSGRDMAHWVPQGPVGGDYQIYEVQVTNDEQRVYYSYTGGLLSFAGMDWVDISGQRATTCTPPAADQACIKGLAGFLVRGNDVFITTASDQPTGAIDQYGLDGTLKDHIELGLLSGFLEDFALGPDRNHIYFFGSCGYSGGMAALDLTSRTANVIIHAQPAYSTLTNHPCGQSSAFVSDTLIALGRVSALLPGYGAGQILFVDSSNGRLVRSVPVTSEPIAVVAIH